jgi:hypothetical protein
MSQNKGDYVAAEERLPEEKSSAAPSHEAIAALAYELWIARGSEDGAADEDWFEAERELGVVNARAASA